MKTSINTPKNSTIGDGGSQTTHTILMIEPVAFGFNEQTAGNNYFQQPANAGETDIQQKALAEFPEMVGILKNKGLTVLVVNDMPEPHTPDSIFPNKSLPA